jgi:hypothetical protein
MVHKWIPLQMIKMAAGGGSSSWDLDDLFSDGT